MSRRAWGAVVLLVAALVTLTQHEVSGLQVAGTPIALSIAPSPEVGDCLVRPGRDPQVPPGTSNSARIVPCSAPHSGQVISMTATMTDDPATKVGGGKLPVLADCADVAYWFLGVHPIDQTGDRSALLGPWWPAYSGNFELLRPDPQQRRIGQSWLACVITSPNGLVTNSVAGVLAGAAVRNPVALCVTGTDVTPSRSVSCQQPHPMEILGWRIAGDDVSQGLHARSCVELAERITGMTDPSAQGALRVASILMGDDDRNSPVGWESRPHSEGTIEACTISAVPPRQLAGSMTGLNGGQVPWA